MLFNPEIIGWAGRYGLFVPSDPAARAQSQHEIIQITRHGRGAAVLISQDDLDSLHETLFWLSQPGIREDLAEGRHAVADGATVGADDVRARFGLPKR